jgi:MFS family permease
MDATRKNVTRFGIVSYLTDVSSEMILAVFSIFFTTVLGASTRLLGLLEGLADFSASILDYIAGYVGDQSGRYKRVAVFGYSLSASAKVLIGLFQTTTSAFSFRIIDRLGKSIRGSSRDAWLATEVNDKSRGYAYALHKTFDKLGAITGPLVAYLFLRTLGDSMSTYKLLFALATVPGIIAVFMLLRIPQKKIASKERESIFTAYKHFTFSFKQYVKCGAVFGLSYFSFSFFLLKAYNVGFSVAQVALLYAIVSIAFVLLAVPIGRFGDIVGRKFIIASSYLMYGLICFGFAFATTKIQVVLLLLAFGVFLIIDESQTKAFITDLEHDKRASAIGFYNFVLAFSYVFASIIAGYLWSLNSQGSSYAFLFSAMIALYAFLNYIVRMRDVNPNVSAKYRGHRPSHISRLH